MWRATHVNNELGYLAEISKLVLKLCATFFLLTAYSTVGEDRSKLREL